MKLPRDESLIHTLDCVSFYVPDLEAGLKFYREGLGLGLVWRTKDAIGLSMPGTETEVVLQRTPQAPEIDFKVRSADAAAGYFQDAGGTVVVPPFDIQIGRAVVVQDPWGNRYVLLDASKGTLVTDDQGNVIGNADPGS